MSATAEVSIAITCPGWCELGAGTHAAELWDLEGHCAHYGTIVAVEDPTGVGPSWSRNEPAQIYECPLIPVGVGVLTTPEGRPTHTPGVYLADREYTVEQIEALIPWLHEAVRLTKEQAFHQ